MDWDVGERDGLRLGAGKAPKGDGRDRARGGLRRGEGAAGEASGEEGAWHSVPGGGRRVIGWGGYQECRVEGFLDAGELVGAWARVGRG